jgi:HK97 family phage major capsid protein
MSVKALRERRAPIRKKLMDLGDKIKAEGRAMNTEERAEFDKLNKEFGELTTAIQDANSFEQFAKDDGDTDPVAGRSNSDPRSERREQIRKRREERGQVSVEDTALAVQGWLRVANNKPLKDRHREACQRTGLNPRSKELVLRMPQQQLRTDSRGRPLNAEARDNSMKLGTAGGYTVAPEFMATLERAMLSFDGVRQVADVMRTSTGAPMPWPTTNDTSNEGEMLEENTAGTTTDPTFGTVTFGAYKYGSKPMLLSNELLNDSAFNLAEVVFSMAGERIGRRQARAFTTGTGSGEPLGCAVGSTSGRSATSATAISVDDLFALKRSVDPAYRSDPSCAFMMHDTILGVITLLKDNQNRPLFTESFRDGDPDRLLGMPVKINQNMDSTMASTKRTVLFGTWSKYKIRDVGAVRFRRLDERYAEKDQVGFLAFLRSDGRILDAGTNPIRHLVH